MRRICTVDGCEDFVHGNGYCTSHYYRMKNHGDLFFRRTPPGVPFQWIEDHVSHSGDECLIWPFRRNYAGYARHLVNGKDAMATRTMCERRHGPPSTPDLHAAHSCGKGHLGCINPNHLSWKSVQQNTDDRTLHGTNPIGEKNPQAKLSPSDIQEIRQIKKLTQKQIADLYGVSKSSIGFIQNKKRWGHIPDVALG